MFEPSQIIKERYQLHKPLGRTAAGRKTWLAEDIESKEKVILKLLAFSPEMEWEELKLFERKNKNTYKKMASSPARNRVFSKNPVS